MEVYKVINNNIRSHIINSNIVEYNIRKAYPTILNEIDPEKYGYLLSLSKDQYVEEINKIFETEGMKIRKAIGKRTIEIYNEWLERNKIRPTNFLATTTDSIIICNQIAPINGIDDFYFRNKDKISYTSLFYIDNDTYILFDRITKKIKIQSKSEDPYISDYPFVKKILKDVCCVCNEYSDEKRYECLRRLSKLRMKYITSEDQTIYADVLHKGEYKYNINDSLVYTPNLYQETGDVTLVKDDNYIHFVFPLIQSIL